MFFRLGNSLKSLVLCGEVLSPISNLINMAVLSVCWDFFVLVWGFFPLICTLLDNLGIHQ